MKAIEITAWVVLVLFGIGVYVLLRWLDHKGKIDLDDPDIKNPKGGDWIIGFSLFFGLYGFLSLFLDFFLTEFESYRTFWFRVAQVCVCLLLVIGLMISRSKSRDSN